jgi:hypothetical protein
LRNDRESIASVLEELVDRFSFNNNTNNSRISFRKVGIKISNLARLEKKKYISTKNLVRIYLILFLITTVSCFDD